VPQYSLHVTANATAKQGVQQQHEIHAVAAAGYPHPTKALSVASTLSISQRPAAPN
jgi:hypothetical protein